MSKPPSPPPETLPQLQAALRQLYRRHLMLTRMIRSLELYSQLSRSQCLAGISLLEQPAGRHVN